MVDMTGCSSRSETWVQAFVLVKPSSSLGESFRGFETQEIIELAALLVVGGIFWLGN